MLCIIKYRSKVGLQAFTELEIPAFAGMTAWRE
jgi:hypothetical protein